MKYANPGGCCCPTGFLSTRGDPAWYAAGAGGANPTWYTMMAFGTTNYSPPGDSGGGFPQNVIGIDYARRAVILASTLIYDPAFNSNRPGVIEWFFEKANTATQWGNTILTDAQLTAMLAPGPQATRHFVDTGRDVYAPGTYMKQLYRYDPVAGKFYGTVGWRWDRDRPLPFGQLLGQATTAGFGTWESSSGGVTFHHPPASIGSAHIGYDSTGIYAGGFAANLVFPPLSELTNPDAGPCDPMWDYTVSGYTLYTYGQGRYFSMAADKLTSVIYKLTKKRLFVLPNYSGYPYPTANDDMFGDPANENYAWWLFGSEATGFEQLTHPDFHNIAGYDWLTPATDTAGSIYQYFVTAYPPGQGIVECRGTTAWDYRSMIEPYPHCLTTENTLAFWIGTKCYVVKEGVVSRLTFDVTPVAAGPFAYREGVLYACYKDSFTTGVLPRFAAITPGTDFTTLIPTTRISVGTLDDAFGINCIHVLPK